MDNDRLEAVRKEVIRDGDPMAAYFAQQQREQEEQEEQQQGENTVIAMDVEGGNRNSNSNRNQVLKSKKPMYSGPTPAPNRFMIRPGYRWDAVDRGNSYEHKVLTRNNDRNALKEDEYKWSVSDM